MTYDATERSVQSGKPVEIYDFRRNSKVWRFVNGSEDEIVEGNTYTWAALKRTELEISTDIERVNIAVTCPRNFPIADLFRASPNTDKISLTVRRYHREDGELAVIWKGAVLNAEWDGATATLRCEPASTSLDRPGLQRLCQRGCPYPLYGPGCELNKDDFKIATTVAAIDGVVISLAALGALHYGGGWIEKIDGDGNYERRFIESFSGLDITLSRPFFSLAPADNVNVYAGCDHTMQMCNDDFGNVLNFGGMPFMSLKNPFGSDPIY